MNRLFTWRRYGAGIAAGAVLVSVLAIDPAQGVPAAEPSVSAGPVIVDVADGTRPQSVAAKYGISQTQIHTEAILGFPATVTQKQLPALLTDRAVESVTGDEVTSRRDRPARGANHLACPRRRLLISPSSTSPRRSDGSGAVQQDRGHRPLLGGPAETSTASAGSSAGVHDDGWLDRSSH